MSKEEKELKNKQVNIDKAKKKELKKFEKERKSKEKERKLQEKIDQQIVKEQNKKTSKNIKVKKSKKPSDRLLKKKLKREKKKSQIPFKYSIIGKITLTSAALCLIVGLSIGVFDIFGFSRELENKSYQSLEKVAEQTAKLVESRLETYWAYAAMAGAQYDVEGDHFLQKPDLKAMAKSFRIADFGFIDSDGYTVSQTLDVLNLGSEPYVKGAFEGENCVSSVITDPINGSSIIMLTVPVKRNKQVVGVMYAKVDSRFLSDVTNEITYGETGTAFMIDDDGYYSAHYVVDNVKYHINAFEASKPENTNHKKTLQAAIEYDIGHSWYKFDGSEKLVAFARVPGQQFHVIVTCFKSEILQSKTTMTILSAILTVVFICIGIFASYALSRKMLSPLTAINSEVRRIASGEISQPIRVNIKSKKDEMAELTKSISHMQQKLGEITGGVKNSAVDLNNKATDLNNISQRTQSAIGQISASVTDVANGSTNQAQDTSRAMSNIQKMNNSMELIEKQSNELSIMAEDTARISSKAKEVMAELKEISEKTKVGIQDIVAQSDENVEATKNIESIIDTIKTIATQTNLLSLNANIEAARAGEAGRGFAVVASEIGNLANESAEAATSIQKIIDDLVNDITTSAAKTSDLAEFSTVQEHKIKNTTDAFDSVINNIVVVRDATTDILKSIREMDEVKSEIEDIITGLSSMSEENAAATEETAASISMIMTDMDDLNSSAESVSQNADELKISMEYFK